MRFGQQKRYQDWFQRQYLSMAESQSLRCDLIRYICGVVHPSNEVLSSDILPRWAIIGWLLTTCTVSAPSVPQPFPPSNPKWLCLSVRPSVRAFGAVERGRLQRQAGALLRLALLQHGQGQHHEHR